VDWIFQDLLGPIPLLIWIIGSGTGFVVLALLRFKHAPDKAAALSLFAFAILLLIVASSTVMLALDDGDVSRGRFVVFANQAIVYVLAAVLACGTVAAVAFGWFRANRRIIGTIAGLIALGAILLVSRWQVLREDFVNHVLSGPADSRYASGPGVALKHRIVENDGMVLVPAGPFIMGSMSSYQLQQILLVPAGDEMPLHSHYLDAFYIDKYEVTNAQFRKFIDATGYVTDSEKLNKGRRETADGWRVGEGLTWTQPRFPGDSIDDRDDHPVAQVSWNDARLYCDWVGKRLPSEAEWEKAARGPFGATYPWGNNFDSTRLNYCDVNCVDLPQNRDESGDDGFRWTAPVGSFELGRGPYGAYDMAGNVWEWVSDVYDAYYYHYSPYLNPMGPKARGKVQRVVRGGSFASERGYGRAASRSFDPPDISFIGVGFRCARDPAL